MNGTPHPTSFAYGLYNRRSIGCDNSTACSDSTSTASSYQSPSKSFDSDHSGKSTASSSACSTISSLTTRASSSVTPLSRSSLFRNNRLDPPGAGPHRHSNSRYVSEKGNTRASSCRDLSLRTPAGVQKTVRILEDMNGPPIQEIAFGRHRRSHRPEQRTNSSRLDSSYSTCIQASSAILSRQSSMRRLNSSSDHIRFPAATTTTTTVTTSTSANTSSPATAAVEDATTLILIAPGVKARLRGTTETLAAVTGDAYTLTQCLSCQATLGCIANAAYILCPSCKVVSPLSNDSDGDKNNKKDNAEGVGLGFTMEHLQTWQSQIIVARQQHQQERPSMTMIQTAYCRS